MPVDRAEVELPAKPGVYIFKQIDGTVMYVGKATVLKERIRSYFSKNPDRQMIPDLVQNSDEIDYIITRNPSEALMLERQLIRKHKPRYNSLLKDDKSYPFIAITSEDVPRIMYSRHPPTNSSRWGPFPDAKAAKRVIQLLRRHFGIRDEKNNLPFGYEETDDSRSYKQRINAAKSVLDGNATILIQSLQSEMDEHSRNLRYEAAGMSRDLIAAVQQTISQQIIHSRF
ncbi:MAG: GIY-YIG nuclease family protein, partial [Candidatus Thermoplasmatota archaeon]|nr:GIY-YIG nuclease family protein [Candidatus Thermoplasmatota archaeon]